MDITDAYQIALAANSHQKMENEGFPSSIYDYFNEEIEEIWEGLSETQQDAFKKFAVKNANLFEAFPEQHLTEEDMEERQYAIEKIEDRIYDELSSVVNFR